MSGQKSDSPASRRAALYIRVSTEEQVRQGYSLQAQRDSLEAYARANGYTVAGIYADEGRSARKKYASRKEFMRMLEDVKAGKIDVILFIKLDRWFRNVADYYKIQEILDAHHVAWKTTQEHYDTETTNGRLYINIRLSVAQDESDRDSDRIKFVFDSKVARGEAITGSGSLPFGLTVRDKRVVPDPEAADAARALFRHYREHGSVSGAMAYIREVYGVTLWDHSVRLMLRNPLYKGVYRDNPNYCQPLIPPEEFDAVQEQLKSRSIRQNPTRRIYLFSGLLTCGCCGRKMSGVFHPSGGQGYYLYRCRTAAIYRTCGHRSHLSERKLEDWLLDRAAAALDGWEADWATGAEVRRTPRPGGAAIRRKMERLKDLYVNDLITLEQYREDLARYSAQYQAAQEPGPLPSPDLQALRSMLAGGLSAVYPTLDRGQRRDFWRGFIREICLDGGNVPRVVFAERYTN